MAEVFCAQTILHITNTLSIENLTKMMYNIVLVRKNVVRIIN